MKLKTTTVEVYCHFIACSFPKTSGAYFHCLNFAVDTFSHCVVGVKHNRIDDAPEVFLNRLSGPLHRG